MDLQSLLFGKEEWQFLLNAFVRTVIMFIVILVGLRIMGKRGIHQLSVFELGVIIGLGSAAGDPMLYRDVGILPPVVVFIAVIAMYRLVTYIIAKNDRFETLMEGRPSYILRDGVILEAFKDQPLGHDEFFAALRQNHVSHLGQVETVIIEADGTLSVFFYPDDKVRPGLPILPEDLDQHCDSIAAEGLYSCFLCGTTERLSPSQTFQCRRCEHDTCVKAAEGRRVV
ncbi:MAG TPA: YetF domain-containing protein [Cyclobacteriaceae bacterium]